MTPRVNFDDTPLHPTDYTSDQVGAAVAAAYVLAMDLPPAQAEAVRALAGLVLCYHGKVVRAAGALGPWPFREVTRCDAPSVEGNNP